jgi:glucokinase
MNYLAADIGGSHAECAVVDANGVRRRRRVAMGPGCSFGQVLPLVADSFARMLEESPNGDGVAGVALAFCGLVDPVHRRVLSTSGKYHDAPAVDLGEWARSRFGLGLRIENDARMALLGERCAGAARGFDDIVMLTIGTGVGGAAMMNARLVRGRHNQAGCLGGHFLARVGGRRCSCGGAGCVEAEASTWALPEICREQPGFASSALAGEPALDFHALFRCVEANDACALRVLDHCAEVWAAGVVSLIHAYDPEVVVVGGGVMRAAPLLLPRISDYVKRNAWTPWGKVEIRAAALGDDASLLGAEALWEDPSL